MVRAAAVLEPTSIAIENVPGVVRDRGCVVDVAIARLEALGYEVDHGVVEIAELGVPQLRVRHVLLGSLVGKPSVKDMVATHRREHRSLRWAIEDLVDLDSGRALDTPSVMSAENMKRAAWLLKHDEYDLPNRKRPPCHRDKPKHRYKSMYGRLAWDLPAQTITTGFGSPGQGRYLHPTRPRALTPHEAARVQFFPDWFSFDAATHREVLARCIGNAVPPKLGYAMARYLFALAMGVQLKVQPGVLPGPSGAAVVE